MQGILVGAELEENLALRYLRNDCGLALAYALQGGIPSGPRNSETQSRRTGTSSHGL